MPMVRADETGSPKVRWVGIESGRMDTLRLLKIAGIAVGAVLALFVLSVLASVLLWLLGAVVMIGVVVGLAYLAYRLYAAISAGGTEELGVESKVQDLEEQFER